MEGRQNEGFWGEKYRELRHWGKQQLELLRGPTWVRVPESLQIDTTNFCNCKCCYCNVREGGSFNIPRGRMPSDMIKHVIKYWGGFKEMKVIAPFMNGEPLLDERLPKIFDYTMKHSTAYNLIDTNGVAYENREMLVHPNLKIVRFTISANTAETYRKVHGISMFEKTLKTFWWFDKHRLENQNIVLHFIVTKHNEHEIEDWTSRFNGFLRMVFPLHRMVGIQDDSEQVLGVRSSFIQTTEQSLEEWKKTRPLMIFPDGTTKRDVIPKYKTCQGMSYAVMWDGTIMHCTDAPPEYNYGHVYKQDMLEAWHLRNRARLTNPACIMCNAKRPDWKQILRKYVL